MKATELMIDNYVQLPCGSVVQVMEISSFDKDDETIMFYPRIENTESAYLGSVKPVLINDYWLEKYNFICKLSNRKSLNNIDYNHKKWIFNDWITIIEEDQDNNTKHTEDDSFDVFINNKYITTISYIHQLQNFFHIIP